METIVKKFIPLLAAFLVTVGGLLAFESFTTERVEAEGTRTIFVCQNGAYVANLCIKNRSKSDLEVCTGNVPVGSKRDLKVAWDPGDHLGFVAAVVAGHNAYYEPLADRDTECWSDATSLEPGAYCRTDEEGEC